MKRRLLLLAVSLALVGLSVAGPAAAQGSGVSVTCDNGAQFDNGVEVIVVQMRAGFTYTATAIGLGGFDPVLAVLDPDGTGLCDDDNATAARYTASLPSTGLVPASNLAAQVRFNHNDPSGFRDIRLVVGGFGSVTGSFLLILEGMGVTRDDNQGDPFSVLVTPGMVASGVPLTAYMIARTNQLDPLMYRVDGERNPLTDGAGGVIGCDDAGDANACWGQSSSLVGSYVTTEAGQLGGGPLDAMLSIPMAGFQLTADRNFNYVNFMMTSFQQQTLGQYVVALHVTTAPAA